MKLSVKSSTVRLSIFQAEPYSSVVIKTQRPRSGPEIEHMLAFFASHGRDDLVIMNLGPHDELSNMRRDHAKQALDMVLCLDEQARKHGSGEMHHGAVNDGLSTMLDDEDVDNF